MRKLTKVDHYPKFVQNLIRISVDSDATKADDWYQSRARDINFADLQRGFGAASGQSTASRCVGFEFV